MSEPCIKVITGVQPHEGRNQIIGASECAFLVDLHPNLTREEKFNRVCTDAKPKAPTPAMQAGHYAEPIIFDLLSNGAVEELAGFKWTHHTDLRWHDEEHGLAAMPDGEGVAGDERVLIEVKYSQMPTNLHRDIGREPWWWQAMCQLACAPFPVERAVVVMMDGYFQLRHWWVERDEPAIRTIRLKAKEFWQEVENGKCEYLGKLPSYYELRDDIQVVEGKEAELLDDLCQIYQVQVTAEKQAATIRTEHRDTLLKILGARGEWHTKRFKIKAYGAKGRTPTLSVEEWT